jgi:WD40 repeat protein
VLTISFDSWFEGQVATTTHTVSVVRPKTREPSAPVSSRFVRSLAHPDRKANLSQVRFSPDGGRLFTGGYPSGVLQIWDVATGRELRRIDSPSGYGISAEYVEIAADWTVIYVPQIRPTVVQIRQEGESDRRVDFDGEVLVFDLATGEPRPSLKPPAGHGVDMVFPSPDGRKLVASERLSDLRNEGKPFRVVLWDMKTGKSRPLGPGFPRVAFAPDSKWFALAVKHGDPLCGRVKRSRRSRPAANIRYRISASRQTAGHWRPASTRTASGFGTLSRVSGWWRKRA